MQGLGRRHLKIGYMGKAIECFKKAVKLQSDDQKLQDDLRMAVEALEAKRRLE